jgi:branched-chain amino acid transport system substrate-binding protein
MPTLEPRVRWVAVAIVAALLVLVLSADLLARRPAGPASPATAQIEELQIAFVERVPSTDAVERVLPARHGAQLALEAAATTGGVGIDVGLVRVDPWLDADGLEEIIDDARTVAVIGAPYLSGQLGLGERFDAAGLPFVTLSVLGADLSRRGWDGWFRAVADVDDEAAAIVAWLDDSGFAADDVCLAGDGSPGSRPLLRGVTTRLDGRAAARIRLDEEVLPSHVAVHVERARCAVVVWGGDGALGGDIAAELSDDLTDRPAFVGGSNLRDPAFAAVAGGAAHGAISACSCVDLTTKTRLGAQRFVQDYQSQFGTSPGPFAVEAWDVARWMVRAIEAGAPTRAAVGDRLREVAPFDGLATTYAFDEDGEVALDMAPVRMARFEAGRWAPLA